MVELFDDGMAMLLLDRAPNIDLLGVTVVAGNTPDAQRRRDRCPPARSHRLERAHLRGQSLRHPLLARSNPEALAAEEVVSPVTGGPAT